MPGYPLGALRRAPRACGRDARHRQPDQRPRRSWRRRGWRSRTGRARRTRAAPLARSAGRARRAAAPEAEAPPAFGLPAGDRGRRRGARCCSTCATWARSGCSTIRFRACCGPTRSTGTRARRRDDRGHPADVRGAPPCAEPSRGARRAQRGRARRAATTQRRSRAGARSSPSAIVGAIANRQILKRAPRAYAAAKLDGPVLAPIDATQPLDAQAAGALRRLPQRRRRSSRCVPLAENPPPLGRCTPLPSSHVAIDEWRTWSGDRSRRPRERTAVWRLRAACRAAAGAEVAFCAGATRSTVTSGRSCYSSSRLFPFDADGDGDAQGNPAADARAGGIGTEPLLAFDVPRHAAPVLARVPVIADPAHAGRVGTRAHRRRLGARGAARRPARDRALPAQRLGADAARAARAGRAPPVIFPLGAAGFVLDTRVPGNGNSGHEFGTALSARREAGPDRLPRNAVTRPRRRSDWITRASVTTRSTARSSRPAGQRSTIWKSYAKPDHDRPTRARLLDHAVVVAAAEADAPSAGVERQPRDDHAPPRRPARISGAVSGGSSRPNAPCAGGSRRHR